MTTKGEMLASAAPIVPPSVTRTVIDAAIRKGEVTVGENGARNWQGLSTDNREAPSSHTVEVPVGVLGHDLGAMIARTFAGAEDPNTVTLTIVDDPDRKAKF